LVAALDAKPLLSFQGTRGGKNPKRTPKRKKEARIKIDSIGDEHVSGFFLSFYFYFFPPWPMNS
jgi:hypothetical protein